MENNDNTLLFVKMLDEITKERERKKYIEEQILVMKEERRRKRIAKRQANTRRIVRNLLYGSVGLLFGAIVLIIGMAFTLCI